MDMADGLMVHGTAEKKISVMKDSMVGAGGVSAAILLSFLSLAFSEFIFICRNLNVFALALTPETGVSIT